MGTRVSHSCCLVEAWADAGHRGTWSSDLPGLWGTCNHLLELQSVRRNHSELRNMNSWWESLFDAVTKSLVQKVHQEYLILRSSNPVLVVAWCGVVWPSDESIGDVLLASSPCLH